MQSNQMLTIWLARQCQLTNFHLEPLLGDASFRQYFRVRGSGYSYIAMNAAVEKPSCVPFVAIANTLRDAGLCAPEIIASDFAEGFLLLSDFGNQIYLKELTAQNAKELYTRALNALSIMQRCRYAELKPFTAEFMRNELMLSKEWFLTKHLELTIPDDASHMLADCFTFLAESAAMQPYVFMHRDYHSANLMVLPNQAVGILDFQDAFIGPVTYDLVSLLRDCYIAWPDTLVVELVKYYWEILALPNVSFSEFKRWFDLMGIQRHLKALLTFSRKYRRDNNASYLQHIPRTLNYVLTVSQHYPECHALHRFLKNEVVLKCVE
jgi:aminoglycoside/choline kinase family phosphotransferase